MDDIKVSKGFKAAKEAIYSIIQSDGPSEYIIECIMEAGVSPMEDEQEVGAINSMISELLSNEG